MSIELLPTVDSKTIALKMDGHLSVEDIDRVVAEIEPQLQETREKVRIFVEIDSFTGVSPLAFFKDLWFALRHWHQFEREAVVSDLKWVEQWTRFFGKFVPGIEVRHFPMAQRDDALSWVHH